MTSKKMNPATLRDVGRAPNSFCIEALNSSEITEKSCSLQEFRAGVLARKHRVHPALAAIVAPFAFGQEGAR